MSQKAEPTMNNQYNHLSFRSGLLLSLLLLSCLGCSGAKEDPRGDRIPVSGLIYYDGDPLTSARILFISESPEGKVK